MNSNAGGTRSIPSGRDRKSSSLPSANMGRRASVYEQIKSAILTGDLLPGQQLTEFGLADWLGVSRTPVREAVTRLEQDGLLLRADRGLVVYERSPSEILEVYECRIMLEATAARFAAARRSESDLAFMRGALNALARGDKASPDERAALNSAFHRTVWNAGHNGALIDLLTRITMHLGRYPLTTLAYPGRWEEGNREHVALVEAIEARDVERAGVLATEHFTEARNIRLKIWENEDWPSA